MKRILILGNSCSGKSTLARTLAQRLGLPSYHLDALHWQPGWLAADADRFRTVLEEIVAGREWVIEGNYLATLDLRLAAADTVLFLDYPVWVCLRRLLGRHCFSRRLRVGAPAACNDALSWDMLWHVVSFPWRRRPRLAARLASIGPCVRIVRLESARQTRRFVGSLPYS